MMLSATRLVPASRPVAVPLVTPLIATPVDQPCLPLQSPGAPVSASAHGMSKSERHGAWVFTQALVEVFASRRAGHQLMGRIHPTVRDRVDALTRSYAAETPRVASLRIQTPRRGVAEATVRLVCGTRSDPLALRLVLTSGAWQCTAMEGVGLSPASRGSS